MIFLEKCSFLVDRLVHTSECSIEIEQNGREWGGGGGLLGPPLATPLQYKPICTLKLLCHVHYFMKGLFSLIHKYLVFTLLDNIRTCIEILVLMYRGFKLKFSTNLFLNLDSYTRAFTVLPIREYAHHMKREMANNNNSSFLSSHMPVLRIPRHTQKESHSIQTSMCTVLRR